MVFYSKKERDVEIRENLITTKFYVFIQPKRVN